MSTRKQSEQKKSAKAAPSASGAKQKTAKAAPSASGAKQKTAKVKAKNPLHDQTIEEIGESFDSVPALSFVFLASDTCMKGPSLISAVELVDAVAMGRNYGGPYPESLFQEALPKATQRRTEIIKAVEERVAELRRRSNESFILVWHAYGEEKPRLDHSENYSWCDMRDLLVDFLQQEVA